MEGDAQVLTEESSPTRPTFPSGVAGGSGEAERIEEGLFLLDKDSSLEPDRLTREKSWSVELL